MLKSLKKLNSGLKRRFESALKDLLDDPLKFKHGLCNLEEVVTDVSPTLGTKGKFLLGLADPSANRIKEMLVKDRR